MANYDLFMSYSRRDKDFVQKLHGAIEETGRDVWIDWENIPLTAEWFEEIKRGIEGSDAFVFIITPDSICSEVCQEELKYSLEHNKRLVPILRRDLTLDERRGLNEALSSHNWIYFREEDDFQVSFNALISALNTDLEHTRAHTRLQMRAVEWDARNRDPSYTLRGQDLADALTWKEQATTPPLKEPQITELQREYIAASRVAERNRQRERVFLGVISVLLFVAVAALGLAVTQYFRAQGEADRAQAEANRAQRLSLAANAQIALDNSNRDLAIALALRANADAQPLTEAERALSDAAYSRGTRLVFRGHTRDVYSVAFSPDGRLALSGSADATVRLWEVATGQEVRPPFTGPESSVYAVAFSPDGTRVAAGDDSGKLWVWDVESGQRLWVPTQQHLGRIREVRFVDNDSLVTGGNDGVARWWDAHTGEVLLTFEGAAGPVVALPINPANGCLLIYALEDAPRLLGLRDECTVRLFARQRVTYIVELDGADAIFTPDGRQVLSAAGINLRLWNVETGETIREFVGHGGNVNNLAIDAAGRFAVSSARRENSMRLWNVASGTELARFEGHSGVVQAVAISPDGRFALSGSVDGTVRVWDLFNGAQIREYSNADTNEVYGLDYSPGGEYVVNAGTGGLIQLWHLATGEVVRTFQVNADRVWVVKFNPLGGTLLSGGEGEHRALRLWDIESGRLLREFIGHTETITTATFTLDGQGILTGSNDRTIRYWDAETGQALRVFEGPEHNDGQLRSLAMHPDGARFAAGADDVRLIDLASGAVLQTYRKDGRRSTDRVNALDFSPDGRLLVTGGADATITLWAVESGQRLRVFEGHTSQVRSVMFSNDGQRLLSSSADSTVRVWDVSSGLEVRRFTGHRAWVNAALFSPDNAYAISGAWDNRLILWNIHDLNGLIAWIAQNRYSRDLTCNERSIYLVEERGSVCVAEGS